MIYFHVTLINPINLVFWCLWRAYKANTILYSIIKDMLHNAILSPKNSSYDCSILTMSIVSEWVICYRIVRFSKNQMLDCKMSDLKLWESQPVEDDYFDVEFYQEMLKLYCYKLWLTQHLLKDKAAVTLFCVPISLSNLD